MKGNAQISRGSTLTSTPRVSLLFYRGGGERLLPIVGIITYPNNPKSEAVTGLNLASDIYLACHNFGDEGLTVLFEKFDFPLLCGY